MMNLLFFIPVLFLVFLPGLAYGETLNGFGIIHDVLVSDSSENIYFFEQEVRSQTWVHDTKILYSDSNSARMLSDDLFVYPTEINEINGYLVFATLSDECLGNTMCDFQDVIIMSKTDGSYKKIVHHMKSAVQISTDGDSVYLSESSGKLWKFSQDGKDMKLLYEGDNLIMDMTVSDGIVYWIEEILDQNSMILMLKDGRVTEIADDLQIPYDLSHNDNGITWNEIRIGPKNNRVVEYTKSSVYDGDSISTLAEYDNKTPLSTFVTPVYGPYLFLGDYLFITNNTANNSAIHLIDYKTNQNYQIKTVEDYDVMYFRNSNDSLYVIGQNEDGFLIEKIPLPVAIPEFSSMLVFTTIVIGLSLPVFLRRSFHY
jgi:hypothetical protein